MIVPQNRLLFWFAVVAVPFSVLGAVVPHALIVSLILVAALLVVMVVDAFMALGRLDGLRVTFPKTLRASKDRSASLQMEIQSASRRPASLRVGLPLPVEISCAAEEQTIRWPAGQDAVQVHWNILPRRRGCFELTRTSLETPSPLGLWAVRRGMPAQGQMRVYPNLLSERRHLAGLFLNKGMYGIHAQRQVGKGREFEKLREYIPGDGSEDIHWKATAKRGYPVTKVFQVERTQEIYVVLDISRLSARTIPVPETAPRQPDTPVGAGEQPFSAPAKREPVLERYLTAALIMGLAAEQQGDLFGFVTFSDKVDRFLRAKSGKDHYHACRDAIYTAQPKPVTPDYQELAAFIRLRLRRRALLVFLTALDDPVLAESFVQSINLLARQHLVLVNLLKPTGVDPLFSQPDVGSYSDLYDRLGGHLQWWKLRELQNVLERRGVAMHLLENERLSSQLVTQYLEVKRRQAL